MVNSRLSVLIADDEDLARYTIKILISRNHPDLDVVAEAVNGDEAVRLVNEHNPDLAILDIRMPVLNGLDAARNIRKNNPETAILILTAYEDFSSAQQAVNAGVNGYLLKPVTPEDFAIRLESIRKWRNGPAVLDDTEPDKKKKLTWRLERATTYIRAHLSEDLPLDTVAKNAGISPQHLSRLFRNELNTNFVKHITERRMDKACKLLNKTTLGIAEIAERCGYRDANYFAKVFRRNRRLSPGNYRNSIEIKLPPTEES